MYGNDEGNLNILLDEIEEFESMILKSSLISHGQRMDLFMRTSQLKENIEKAME